MLFRSKVFLFSDHLAFGVYGAYLALVYTTPVLGGFLADRILGFKRAIYLGGILIMCGHVCLSLTDTSFFYLGLSFIIAGTGFFKSSISSLVGELYAQNDPRRDSGFTLFYMGINIGAFTASLLCGYLGETYGWSYGFGAAGIGMLLGLIIFLWGQEYLDGNAEPPSDLHLQKYLNITYETWAYISGIFMVLSSWILIQNQEVVGNILGGLGVICIGFWLFYALVKLDPIERDRLLTVGFLILFSL